MTLEQDGDSTEPPEGERGRSRSLKGQLTCSSRTEGCLAYTLLKVPDMLLCSAEFRKFAPLGKIPVLVVEEEELEVRTTSCQPGEP